MEHTLQEEGVQQLIKKSFLELLEQKPLNKITVNELAARCGINRNSFYYHYPSIPALLEELVIDEANQVIREHPSISSVEECLNCSVEYAMLHRKALLHVYQSVRRDLFEVHLWRICTHVVNRFLDTVLDGKAISADDYEAVSRYYQCLCFGVVIHWMEDGMRDDIQQRIRRLCRVTIGPIESFAQS